MANDGIGKDAWWIFKIVFGFGVAIVGGIALISLVTGPLGLLQKTFNADNIIHNYEWFHRSHTAFTARVNQIKGHKVLASENKDAAEASRIRIELVGMQQSCRELAAKYNAQSAMVNRSIFRGTSTPAELNPASCE
jgi:hypothetical protein